MNKTIDVSLAGMLFHLDEPAYRKLKNYLEHISKSLSPNDDKDEIMNEIEARIAELFSEKISHPQQVINLSQIDEIIEIIGKPEDFSSNDEQSFSKATVKKKLFRDPENSMIGGVAAGFAHYLGIDITLMRILFIILFFVTHGGFLLIYILLWILIPKAKTASDFLRMKGENPTINNIVEQISSDDDSKKKFKGRINKMESNAGSVLLKIFGLFMALISGIVLIGLIISGLAMRPFSGFFMELSDEVVMHSLHFPLGLLTFLILLIAGIPFLILFVLGIKLLLPDTRKISSNFYWITGAIWVLSLIFVSVELLSVASEDFQFAKVYEQKDFYVSKDTLKLKTVPFTDISDEYYTDDNIHLDFEASSDSLFHVDIIKKTRGAGPSIVKSQAEKIYFPVSLDTIDHSLLVPEEFAYIKNKKIKKYSVDMIIYVPENKLIKLEGDFSDKYENDILSMNDIIKNENGTLKINNRKISSQAGMMSVRSGNAKINIGDRGIYIKSKDGKDAEIQIDNKGIRIKTQEDDSVNVEMKIDENGIILKKSKDGK